jgi:hemerythrin
MAVIEWSDKYSVGIKSIDEQHKIWVGLINKLHDAMKKGEAKNVMADILDEVAEYTKTHLSYEENLFAQYHYPESETHKIIHEKFTQQVLDYQKQLREGKNIISVEMMDILSGWLTNHIVNTDKKYTEFFNSKGLK